MTYEQYEQMLSNFAYHVGEIMNTCPPATFRLTLGGYAGVQVKTVSVEIKATQMEGRIEPVDVWDQVTVDGRWEGNRCGGRNAYTKAMAPVLLEAARSIETPKEKAA
jgi:hypothetical protein